VVAAVPSSQRAHMAFFTTGFFLYQQYPRQNTDYIRAQMTILPLHWQQQRPQQRQQQWQQQRQQQRQQPRCKDQLTTTCTLHLLRALPLQPATPSQWRLRQCTVTIDCNSVCSNLSRRFVIVRIFLRAFLYVWVCLFIIKQLPSTGFNIETLRCWLCNTWDKHCG
jgi:hypothetical protein